MKNGSEERKFRLKLVGAAALIVLFSAVVMSLPENRLTWQGPLVMGTLAMPKPNPAKITPIELRPDSNSLFSLLGFLSVVGIFGLGGRWFFTKPSSKKPTEQVIHPLVFP